MYVGQTGRGLATRVREHQAYVRRHVEGKAVYQHMFNSNHAIEWDGAKLVYNNSSEKQRLVVESSLIQHLPTFNLLPGTCSVIKSVKD